MCLAVPGKILLIKDENPLTRSGVVSFSGVKREVSLACVPDAQEGDFVLVHVGLAISVLDEVEAKRVFSYLEELGTPEETG